MSRAWQGLVPSDTTGPHDAQAEMAAAQGAPQGELPPATPTPADQALLCARDAQGTIGQLLELERLRNTPAQSHPITFIGASNKYIRRSEHPPAPAPSFGVINPLELTIYIGLDGGRAAPNSHAFTVPAKSAMIVPVAIDKVDLGVDPAVLGAESGTIFLLRFQTVQAFFLGAM